MKIPLYLAILTPTIAFQCFQCNNGIDEDDAKPCIDQKTECPKGTKSCSTILYVSKKDDKIHMRKFCTPSGIPLPQYLRLFRNGATCQNIFMKQEHVQFTSLFERRRREALPPAPPRQYKNNLLCVCITSLCNGRIHEQTIIDRIISNPPKHNVDFSLQELDD
ncbi:hypothetical protein ACH3XW_35775 [Acanthocheilonema viteae]|uniref:UPAR/Ly6 domain-containing protein n=1 Tax=Acanthocheilonema viteae TaxID=6277 RepID=A0A498SUC0_ACAVI|nr:unnamed protein product [Acanthocheilonema viteae]